jgi:diamine N-acetyltransferase
MKLKVNTEQEAYVANNAVSVAQGSVESAAWYRAARNEAGDYVGFVMLYDPGLRNEPLDEIDPEDGVYIWRLMVGSDHQGKGIGSKILEHVFEYVKGRGYPYVYTSVVEGEHSPKGFYMKLGFEPTGRVPEGETELRKAL